jgi:hypothetical protein
MSYRRYLTTAELSDYISVDTPDILTLRQAEIDIDSVIPIFYQRGNRKFIYNPYDIPTLTIVDNNSATTTDLPNQSGFFSKTVLEILSGANAGTKIFISEANVAGNTTTLTFADTQSLTVGVVVAKIYQIAKFPRLIDYQLSNSIYYKTIPEFIKEAVAYQYQFRADNPAIFNITGKVTEAEVDQDQARVKFGDQSRTKKDLISPVAWDILDSQGLTQQFMY